MEKFLETLFEHNVLFWLLMVIDYFTLFYLAMKLYRIPGSKKLLNRYPDQAKISQSSKNKVIKRVFIVIVVMLNSVQFIFLFLRMR